MILTAGALTLSTGSYDIPTGNTVKELAEPREQSVYPRLTTPRPPPHDGASVADVLQSVQFSTGERQRRKTKNTRAAYTRRMMILLPSVRYIERC